MFSKAFNAVIVYLREVKSELKKTSFPDRPTTIKNTLVVIVFSLSMAIFLGALDMIFSYILNAYII